MGVFAEYARFYDTFYQQKDYDAECDFVEHIFRRYAGKPVTTVLDLGCGTGGHALPLSQRGYRVTGVDRSPGMLAAAEAKAESWAAGTRPRFVPGDVREVQLGETFDAVISMFAVMSYMTTNDHLLAAFQTARRHLPAGGLFLFDAWFGPGVLTDPPTDRWRVFDVDGDRVYRMVHPELRLMDQVADVTYRILRVRGTEVLEEVDETHTMRFLFPQEVEWIARQAGFDVRHCCPFLRVDDQPTESDWTFTALLTAR